MRECCRWFCRKTSGPAILPRLTRLNSATRLIPWLRVARQFAIRQTANGSRAGWMIWPTPLNIFPFRIGNWRPAPRSWKRWSATPRGGWKNTPEKARLRRFPTSCIRRGGNKPCGWRRQYSFRRLCFMRLSKGRIAYRRFRYGAGSTSPRCWTLGMQFWKSTTGRFSALPAICWRHCHCARFRRLWIQLPALFRDW